MLAIGCRPADICSLRGRCALLGLALVAIDPSSVHAQDYPSKTITIVVPLAAGTGMDIIARLYGEQLAQRLGKPVIIENKPGAGFTLATQTALSAPADGHTLLVGAPANLAYNQTLVTSSCRSIPKRICCRSRITCRRRSSWWSIRHCLFTRLLNSSNTPRGDRLR
jgi:tripartite-type tricarboxylate transporter receptor subunit TctC